MVISLSGRPPGIVRIKDVMFFAALHAATQREPSGEQRGAAGGAEIVRRVIFGEAQAFGCHAVEIWSVDTWIAVAAEVAEAKVIVENDNDVWRFGACRKHGEKQNKQRRQSVGHCAEISASTLNFEQLIWN